MVRSTPSWPTSERPSTSLQWRSRTRRSCGQFPTANEPEQFGLLFEKGNPLVSCVNPAIQALEADGTLAELQKTWIEDSANIPTLQ